MWLPWYYGLALAALFGIGLLWSRSAELETPAAIFREASIIAVLYSAWQLAGRLSLEDVDGAYRRAESIWDFQRAIGLPDEAAWQAAILSHEWLVKAANIYYGGAHVPGMGIFLVWLFFQHREHFGRWRNALALMTAVCLVIQLLPVAPPRFIDRFDMVDTGIAYGQSVYGTFGSTVAGQLQAMPSLHVGWAVLVGLACVRLGRPLAATVGAAHAALTAWVVVVTANHYWLDGIVAAAILVVILAGQSLIARRPAAKPEFAAAQAQRSEKIRQVHG